MRFIEKYKRHLLLLGLILFTWVGQVRAQFDDDPFDDDGGPGGFDPPPDTDVPLDSYQWVMLVLAIAYGLFVFLKHHQKARRLIASKEAMLTIDPPSIILTPKKSKSCKSIYHLSHFSQLFTWVTSFFRQERRKWPDVIMDTAAATGGVQEVRT